MTGIDIVKIERIAVAAQREGFLNKVFTDGERSYAFSRPRPYETLAGIYAAKEAVFKTLRTGLRFPLTRVEITHDANGAPSVKTDFTDKTIYLSISHDGEYAAAIASFYPTVENFSLGDVVSESEVAFPPRRRDTHKGDYGKVKIMGGSRLMPGAPLLSALAATESGAGLTTLCVPGFMLPAYRERVYEQTLGEIAYRGEEVVFDEDNLNGIMNNADCIAVGMGMGRGDVGTLAKIIDYLALNFKGCLVIDGDGLFCLNVSVLPKASAKIILTPHRAEFERLTGKKCVDPENETLKAAYKYNCVIVNKSARTVISDGVNVKINATGSAAMAKGGSGDVLAGMTAALACGFGCFDGAIRASYYLGKAGEYAARQKGENSVTARDIISALNKVFIYR